MADVVLTKFAPENEQDARDFSTIHALFLSAERLIQGNSREMRAAMKIQDRLDVISEEITGRDERMLKAEGGELALTENHATLFRRLIRVLLVDNPYGRRPLSAREAFRIMDRIGIEIPAEE